jgi:hypothetical protein
MQQYGFPPYFIDVKRMAQALINKRGSNALNLTLGKHWIYRFVQSHPKLDARLTRQLDSQRAQCEDLKIINAWFERVQKTREEYGILDEDTYNIDETGTAMGVVASLGASKVVTSIPYRVCSIQPGDRKWATAIECINASGFTIPPFIILKGKVQLATWYS